MPPAHEGFVGGILGCRRGVITSFRYVPVSGA
jgi:hypothetical protein